MTVSGLILDFNHPSPWVERVDLGGHDSPFVYHVVLHEDNIGEIGQPTSTQSTLSLPVFLEVLLTLIFVIPKHIESFNELLTM